MSLTKSDKGIMVNKVCIVHCHMRTCSHGCCSLRAWVPVLCNQFLTCYHPGLLSPRWLTQRRHCLYLLNYDMMVPLLNHLIIQATPMAKRLNHVQVSAVADDTEQAPDVERLQFVINMTMENWETWKRYCHPKDFRLKHREPRDHGAPAQVGDTFITSSHSSLTFERTFLIRNGSDQGHNCGAATSRSTCKRCLSGMVLVCSGELTKSCCSFNTVHSPAMQSC